MALDKQDPAAFAAARGRIWTNLLWVSYQTVLSKLEQDDPATALDWLPLREHIARRPA